MKEVLLIFPGQPGYEEKKHIPLGILYIAGPLVKEGYKVKILDERIEDYKKLDYNRYLCVGISAQTGKQILHGLKIAKYIKEKNPKIKLIWGGVHPSILPESTINNRYVDIIVLGDGELTFHKLVKAIEKGEYISKINGIVYKDNKKIIHNPIKEYLDLDKLDLPPYELLDLNKYYYKEYFAINTSRGCPHRCSFCCVKEKWRARSAEKVIEDIEKIVKKYNPELISFVDNNFFCSKERVRKFCELKIKKKINIGWSTLSRLDYFAGYDDEFVSLLKKSGCKSVLFGAESGNQRILDLMKKDIRVGDIVKSLELCKKHDILPIMSFMIGNLTEKKEEVFETLRFIDELFKINPKLDITGIFIFSPWPGTDLFEEVVRLGLKKPETLEEWGRFNMGESSHNPYIPFRYRRMYKTVQMVSRFRFLKPDFEFDRVSKRHKRLPFFKEVAYRFLTWSAQKRWKYKFFKFGFEFDIYALYMSRFGRF